MEVAMKPIIVINKGVVPRPSRHGGWHPHFRFLQCSARSSSLASSPSSEAAFVRDDLLHLISDQQRGLATQKDPSKRAQIIRVIDSLAALSANMTTTSHDSLSATWRMLWTTEKEQLFIIEKAPLFGTQAGDILQSTRPNVQQQIHAENGAENQSIGAENQPQAVAIDALQVGEQVIDVAGKRLNNIITFPPDGAFFVDSTIEVVNSQRVKFRFTAAALRGSRWSIPVPPFGQGWSCYRLQRVRHRLKRLLHRVYSLQDKVGLAICKERRLPRSKGQMIQKGKVLESLQSPRQSRSGHLQRKETSKEQRSNDTKGKGHVVEQPPASIGHRQPSTHGLVNGQDSNEQTMRQTIPLPMSNAGCFGGGSVFQAMIRPTPALHGFMPDNAYGTMPPGGSNLMYRNIGVQPGFQCAAGSYGMPGANMGMAGFSQPDAQNLNMAGRPSGNFG
ncbi:hypothetical protein L7F22_066059 [Adiantum nelumboides]|nr:hypothetical protein [Adiantum nelumboides]